MPRKTTYPPTETTLAREWARENGIDVSERGRVSKEILKAYRNDMTRLNNGGSPQNVRPSASVDPSSLGIEPLSFQQITQLVQPATAKLLISSATKQPDPIKTQAHIDMLERTVLGTYTPLDCLVVLDAEGRAFAGLELLAAGVRTNTAVRVILSSIGPTDTDDRTGRTSRDKGLDYAIRVIRTMDTAHGNLEKLPASVPTDDTPVSQGLEQRALALIEQESITGHASTNTIHHSLDPVFVDALRLTLINALSSQEIECIDSSYNQFFQALDKGLASEPALIDMVKALDTYKLTTEEAGNIVIRAWLRIKPSEWMKRAEAVRKGSRLRVDTETLAEVLRLQHAGLTQEQISQKVNHNRKTVWRWLQKTNAALDQT